MARALRVARAKNLHSKLTAKQRAELAALDKLPDDRIDTRDIPEVRDWSGAKRGLFHRPAKASDSSS
jgi:hypothetical protein